MTDTTELCESSYTTSPTLPGEPFGVNVTVTIKMPDPTELNDLEGLTQHPGWHRAKDLLAKEWGPAGAKYVGVLERLANNTDREKAAADLQLVIMVRKEIETFFFGLEHRAKQLRNQIEPVVSQSRRGML